MPAADTNPDLEITVKSSEAGPDFKVLVILSHENSITISAIRFNRGNCEPNQLPRLPQALSFGQSFKIGLFSREFRPPLGCLPIELDIRTDKGEHRYSFYHFNDSSGLEVKMAHLHENYYNSYLVLTSHTDSVTINSILVNRGNCHPLSSRTFPITLGFGATLDYGSFDPRECRPVEISIATSRGEYTFSMQR